MIAIPRVAAKSLRPPRSPSGRGYAVLVFFVLVTLLFFFRLGHRDLYSSHEARAAQNAQRMLDTGEWELPVLFDGQADLQKPPGYYWLVAVAGWVNGGVVSEFEARLPAALTGLLTVMMVFGFLMREGRPTAAWVAAVVLATAVHFTAISRTARIDVPLTCAVTASLLLLFRGSKWAAIPMAAGILLKGPIALALIGPVAFLWLWTPLNPVGGRRWALPISLTIAVLLSLPWFLWANHITGGEFYRVFIVHHHVERFAGTSPALASHPWWYYGPRFAADFLPWSPLFAMLIIRARHAGNVDPIFRFGMIWFGAMFVVLSTAHFKRADYLLPLYPGAAIALGCAVESWLARNVVRHSVAGGGQRDTRNRIASELGLATVSVVPESTGLPRHGVADYVGRVPIFALGVLLLALVGWSVMSFMVEPVEQAKEEKRAFARIIRQHTSDEVLLFRTEPHLLAWHLGRPLLTRVEWHDLRAFCDPAGTHFVVMPPEYEDFAKHIVTARKLVEVARLEEYTADKPPRPLVLLRTE